MSKVVNYIVVLIVLILVTGCNSNGGTIENRLDWKVNEFNYTNQEGNPYGLSDLEGTVWVSDFIFTSCTTVCPLQTFNMEELQKRVNKEGLDIEFISFSVDPAVDTPELLKEYGDKFNADFSNWNFLTGYTQEAIGDLALKSFKTRVEDDPNSDQVIHGTRFYLVDQSGTIVQHYTGNQDVPYDQIIKDIKVLVNE
jgi:protein SCO1/2